MSIYDKKERIRPPRVHIRYDVELNGAQVMKELPFVVGVMSDLQGQPKAKPKKLKERGFVEIDRDNFDDVLKNLAPRAAFKAENRLKEGGGELSVELNFTRLADFNPENVVKQVEPMAKLLEVRNKLKDLLSRTEGNDRLEELLAAIVESPDLRDKLKDTLGVEVGSDEGGGDAPAGGDGEGGADAPTSEGDS